MYLNDNSLDTTTPNQHEGCGTHRTFASSYTVCQSLYDPVRAAELDRGENGEVDARQEEYEYGPEKGSAMNRDFALGDLQI